MKIEIIPADFDDAEILVEMIREFHEHEHIDFIDVNIRKLLIEIFSEKEYGQIFLVKSDEEFAGYFLLTYSFSFEFNGKYIFVDEIFIKENFRGKGLGKKCLKFIEEKSKQENISAIRLEVSRKNLRAMNLYKSIDFIDQNRDLLTKFL